MDSDKQKVDRSIKKVLAAAAAITVLAVRSILIDHSFLPSGRSRLCLPWLSRLSVFAKRLCMRITDVEPVRQIRNTQTNGRFPKK